MLFLKSRNTLIVIVLTSMVSFFPGASMAQAANTTQLTFVINPFSGGLLINVPTNGVFGSLESPDTLTVVSLQLDTVTVTDTRRMVLIRSWSTAAISSDLLTGSQQDSLTAISIGYSAGTPSVLSGVVGVTEYTQTSLLTSVNVQSGSTTTGNHVVSWRPTLSIAVPALKNSGTYVGTLTHSVS